MEEGDALRSIDEAMKMLDYIPESYEGGLLHVGWPLPRGPRTTTVIEELFRLRKRVDRAIDHCGARLEAEEMNMRDPEGKTLLARAFYKENVRLLVFALRRGASKTEMFDLLREKVRCDAQPGEELSNGRVLELFEMCLHREEEDTKILQQWNEVITSLRSDLN
jgi:hypothetical protein